MEYKSLNCTIMSAADLKSVKLIGKMAVYVVASVSSEPMTIQKTPVDKDGDTCPSWNHTVRFIVNEAMALSDESVVFQVKHQGAFGQGKAIGEVRVLLKNLILDKKVPQIETYEVFLPSGKPKGTMKILYGVEDVLHQRPPLLLAYPSPQAASSSALYSFQPLQGPYPTVAHPLPSQTGYLYLPQQPTTYPSQQLLPLRPRRNGRLGGLIAGLIGSFVRGAVIAEMVSDTNPDGNYAGNAGDFGMDF